MHTYKNDTHVYYWQSQGNGMAAISKIYPKTLRKTKKLSLAKSAEVTMKNDKRDIGIEQKLKNKPFIKKTILYLFSSKFRLDQICLNQI